MKSNEPAISRFSSQDSKPLKREEGKNLKFNQFIRNANISHCKILTFFNNIINLYRCTFAEIYRSKLLLSLTK